MERKRVDLSDTQRLFADTRELNTREINANNTRDIAVKRQDVSKRGDPPRKRKRSRPRGLTLGIILIAGAFAFNSLVVVTSLTPKRYEVAEGSPASETVYAPRMVENPTATQALQQAARNGVPTVYQVDSRLADTLISGAKSFFTALASFRSTANDVRTASIPTRTLADGTVVASDDTRTWQEVIPQSDLLAMILKLPVSITDTTLGYALLDASEADLTLLEEIIMSKLQIKLRDGVSEENLGAVRAEITKELQVTTLPVRLKSLGETLYDTYLLPTDVVDATATANAKERAAADVEPIYYARGAVIVEQGQVVDSGTMQLLISLDIVKGANVNRSFTAGVLAYLACAYAMLLYTVYTFDKTLLASSKRMFILFLILVINIALQWGSYLIDPRLMTSVFAVLLTAILLSRTTAQAVNVTLALSFALLAGGSGATLLNVDCTLALAGMLVTGQVTILLIERNQRRGALIGAGAVGGVAGTVMILAGSMLRGAAWMVTLTYCGLNMLAALLLSVFCVGMLSVWENAFDVVTNARLHELANTNHPLLKKLMTSAPGTYHHSIMTASLAEGAAQAIGANALLARTCALYHDVGKLRRPQYFKENQKERNIHDTLPPEESARFIISHVKDADALLGRYRMPSAVRSVVSEHHGNSLVAYFYYNALKEQKETENGEPVIERLFRYAGSSPTSVESAVVMLSDSCEAAVRSLSEPTQEQMQEMIQKVIRGKLDDEQLSKSPLTMADLKKIEKSFLITFSGLMHERIRYPDKEYA